MEGMARLFVALELSESAHLQLESLPRNLPGMCWVPPENLHLTLRFLGEVSEENVIGVATSLLAVRAGRFSLRLRGLEVFETPRQTILWAGVEPCEELRGLQIQVDLALERGLGLEPAAAPYVPHITLGRAKRTGRAARDYVRTYAAGINCEIPVTSFTLFRSVLIPGGAVYSPEKIYPLD